MSEILCAECGKPEDDTKHVKYGPDEESVAMGMKHHFVELVGDSESLSGAVARIRELILKVV